MARMNITIKAEENIAKEGYGGESRTRTQVEKDNPKHQNDQQKQWKRNHVCMTFYITWNISNVGTIISGFEFILYFDFFFGSFVWTSLYPGPQTIVYMDVRFLFFSFFLSFIQINSHKLYFSWFELIWCVFLLDLMYILFHFGNKSGRIEYKHIVL